MCYFWQLWEEWRNEGEMRVEECTRCESATLLVSRSRRFVRQRSRWYTMRWASFENECSISWDEMNIILKQRVSFDSRRAVLHRLLEHGCDLLCIWVTVIRDRDGCKIYIVRYWMSNTPLESISVELLEGCSMWSGRVQRTLSMWRSILEETLFL